MASRSWCFTLNNPKDLQAPGLMDNIKYCCWQLEKGAEGTPHLQGVVLFTYTPRLPALKKIACMAGAHWEPKRGSWAQAIAYVSKEESRVEGPWTIGAVPSQGARNDIALVKEVAKSRKRVRDMTDEEVIAVRRSPKMWQLLKQEYRPQRGHELQVILLVGKTGCGKTRHVYDQYGGSDDFYALPVSKDFWFDGYDGESVVLLDDFVGQFPLAQVLRLLDRYPVQVPVKGGFTWWCPDKIFITSNLHPREWYSWKGREEQYRALCRRIKLVYEDMVAVDEFTKLNTYDDYDI